QFFKYRAQKTGRIAREKSLCRLLYGNDKKSTSYFNPLCAATQTGQRYSGCRRRILLALRIGRRNFSGWPSQATCHFQDEQAVSLARTLRFQPSFAGGGTAGDRGPVTPPPAGWRSGAISVGPHSRHRR